MRKFKLICFLVIISVIFSAYTPIYAENDTAAEKAAAETAWVVLGEKTESRNIIYTDGYESGVKDKNVIGYSELFESDGIYGRKVYKQNYIDLKISPDYYESGDRNFIITVIYYDFGPSPGTFGVYYASEGGSSSKKSVWKDAVGAPRWATKSVEITNAEFGTNEEYDIRLQSNLYNAFACIEVVNVDKANREGRETGKDTVASSISEGMIASAYETDILVKLRLFKLDNTADRVDFVRGTVNRGELITSFVRAIGREREALAKNLPTSFDDVDKSAAPYLGWAESKGIVKGGGDGKFMPNENATVRQLLAFYVRYIGLDEAEMNEKPLEFAKQHRMFGTGKYIYQADNTLTRDQLAGIAYNALITGGTDGECIIKDLVKDGILTDKMLDSTDDLLMKGCKYFVPRYVKPYEYVDSVSGRVAHLVDFEGNDAIRAYFTAQQWNSDATKFIFGVETNPGMMFEYDTENETMTLLDFAYSSYRLEAYVNGQDKIFYEKKDGNDTVEHWVMDWKTKEKRFIAKLPDGITSGMNVTPSDDGTLMSIQWDQLSDPRDFFDGKARTRVLATLDTVTGEYNSDNSYEFDVPGESHEMGHQMLNPVTKDLMMFCHEGDATVTKDRIWMCDLKTGKSWNVFKQGENEDGTTAEPSTHEVWTPNGESIVFVKSKLDQTKGEYGLCRVKPDGSDREYFTNCGGYSFWHCSATEDGNWVAGDVNRGVANIVISDTRTYEQYCLATYNAGPTWYNDPYQPHVTFERGGRKICWEMYNEKSGTGSYGFAWMDIEDITSKPVEGGREKYSDEFDYVSYKESELDVKRTEYKGKECLEAGYGKKIYLDVNDDLANAASADVKISFSYFDDCKNPLTLKYTSSVEKVTDLYNQENMSVQVKRSGTNEWKNAEFVLKNISLKNSCKHLCDFVFGGEYSSVKISDLKIEILKKASDK